MNYRLENYKISNFFVLLSLCFLTISISLVGLAYEPLVILARILTYSLTIILIFYFFATGREIKIDIRLIFLITLFFWVGIRSSNAYGLGLLLQTLLLLTSTTILSKINLAYKVNKAILVGGLLYVALALIHLFYQPIFLNSNYVGVCGLIFSVFFLSKKTNIFYILAIICFSIMIASGTRSAILGLVLAYILYKILNQKPLMRIVSLFVIILTLVIFFKSGVYDYINSDSFAQLVIDKTGKRLESGRGDIWNLILSKMEFSDYIFGLGGGVSYENIIGSKLSAHSGYIYILSSYGLIGLFLFLSACIASIINFIKNSYYFSFLLFIALLFREFFEVTLLHNSFPIALFFWAFLSNGYLDRLKPSPRI